MRGGSIRFGWLPLAAFCILSQTSARATEHDTGAWLVFSSTDRIGEEEGTGRWRYWFDAQARFFDVGSGASQYVLRPGIGYDLNDKLTIWAGYARIFVQPAAGGRATENRYWQQLTWTAARRDKASLNMRVRLEQRSLSTGDDRGLVLRYQLKYVRQLPRNDRLDLILTVEPFFDLKSTDWGAESGLSQNRSFAGVGWSMSDAVSFEAGYMNLYQWRDTTENQSHHFALINLKTRF